MAIPARDILIEAEFQALKELGEAHIKEIDRKVAQILSLGDDDAKEIHEGNRTKLSYELAWGRFYLRKFGLIEKIARGKWILTQKGIEAQRVNSLELINSYEKYSNVEIEEDVDNDLEESITREEGNPDVEKEENEQPVEISEPFDPKQIDIKDRRMMLKGLFDRLNFDEIDLFTDFQREGDLWDITKQSRLIESILIRFPLPAFYFDGSDDNKWLIVDGLQRISAMKNFIINKKYKGKPFRLTNMEFLTAVEGCTYDELPRELKRRIDETEITIYVISPGTPPNVKFNLFKRINTSGLFLEPQEIRHALNQGTPADFIKELAGLQEFKRATSYSIKTHRMLDRDFVTRYISFYIIGYINYEPDLDTFLNKGMSLIRVLNWNEMIDARRNFIKAMNACFEIFGRYAFRKRYSFSDSRKPINKALFEIWSVALAKVTEDKITRLVERSIEVNEKFIYLMSHDKAFDGAITSATGDKRKVMKRFSEIEKLINSF